MKHLLVLTLLLSNSVFAQELKPIASPDLKSALSSDWSVRHGTWDIQDGVMTIAELPENKHAAVLWHQVPLQTGAVECEFRFDGAKVFILGCDGARHIGRIVITQQAIRLLDDSTEVKGQTPSTLLATGKLDLKPGEWHKLRYEWNGDRMAAKLDDVTLEATSPNLGAKKSRWWFAVGGASVKVRGVTVFGPQP